MESKNRGNRKRYDSRQRKHRLKMMRIRAAVAFLLAVVLVAVLLFVTPIFNIKNISVSGNSVVTLDQISACIGDIVGKNLFATWNSTIEERLKDIACIDEVTVSKALIPPTLYVNIKESKTAAYFECDGKKIIVNPEMKVLDDSGTFSTEGIPLVRGIEPSQCIVGKPLELSDREKCEAMAVFLRTMSNIGQMDGVLYLDLSDIASIKFNYNGTLDVSCGSALELDKKLRMFKAVMTSGSVREDVRGSVDLTNPEKAILTP